MQSLFPCYSSHSADSRKIDLQDWTATYVRKRLLAAGLAVLVMLLIKRHYSSATATQLDWILAPTAKLLDWFTSAHPVLESNIGYVDFASGIIVAPACAGVNFMIMAFGLAAFCGLHHLRRLPSQLVWLILALAAGYYLTLIVNTMRIAISMALYDANIYAGRLTAARVHRVAGVGLYLGALWLYFLALRPLVAFYSRSFSSCQKQCPFSHSKANLPEPDRGSLVVRHSCGSRNPDSGPRIESGVTLSISLIGRNFWHLLYRSRKRNETSHSWGWLVLVWYILCAVGVPLANGAGQQNLALFIEHCATVLLAGLAFWVLGLTIKRVLMFQVQSHR